MLLSWWSYQIETWTDATRVDLLSRQQNTELLVTQTHTIIHTHSLFALKMNYVTQTEKRYIRILQKLYLGSKVNNYDPWAKSSYVFIKFYWSTATPLHLRIIYTSFHVPIAELSSRARPLYGAQSLKSLLSGPLQKSSLTLYRSKNVSIMIWMSWSNRRSSSPVFLNQKSTLKYFHIIFGYSTILLRICVAKTS